eukprot:4918041-Prymnesium_polylepis.1
MPSVGLTVLLFPASIEIPELSRQVVVVVLDRVVTQRAHVGDEELSPKVEVTVRFEHALRHTAAEVARRHWSHTALVARGKPRIERA